jgi:hypothetical protein
MTASRVVRIAVVVRIDGAFEAGDDLVGPRVHGRRTPRIGLPAADPDREDRRACRDAGEVRWTARADDHSGQLRAMTLELSRVVGLRRGGGRAALGVAEQVDAAANLADEVRVPRVDARVEERDRNAASVEAGQDEVGSPPATRREGRALELRLGNRRRVGGADGVNAAHVRCPFDERDRPRVERGREPVDHARVRELGRDAHPLQVEP